MACPPTSKLNVPLAPLDHLFGSLEAGWLECTIFFGETWLRNAVLEFLSHYHGERNHQGLGNRIIAPGREVGRVSVEVGCRDRLGGLLRYYRYHEAA